MYLVDKEQFLALPPATIFSRFYPELMTRPSRPDAMQPVAFGDLCIKGATPDAAVEFIDLIENHASSEDKDADGKEWKSLEAGINTINRYRRTFETKAGAKLHDPAHESSACEEIYAVWDDHEVRNLAARLTRATHTFSLPALLATVDEFAAKWVIIEDSAATS